jgi:REP element-mobilizing transposase RayT
MNRILGTPASLGSANKANRVLGRSGAFWQREYFDRFVRDAENFAAAVEYIANNPVKAGLCQSSTEWKYSSCWQSAD